MNWQRLLRFLLFLSISSGAASSVYGYEIPALSGDWVLLEVGEGASLTALPMSAYMSAVLSYNGDRTRVTLQLSITWGRYASAVFNLRKENARRSTRRLPPYAPFEDQEFQVRLPPDCSEESIKATWTLGETEDLPIEISTKCAEFIRQSPHFLHSAVQVRPVIDGELQAFLTIRSDDKEISVRSVDGPAKVFIEFPPTFIAPHGSSLKIGKRKRTLYPDKTRVYDFSNDGLAELPWQFVHKTGWYVENTIEGKVWIDREERSRELPISMTRFLFDEQSRLNLPADFFFAHVIGVDANGIERPVYSKLRDSVQIVHEAGVPLVSVFVAFFDRRGKFLEIRQLDAVLSLQEELVRYVKSTSVENTLDQWVEKQLLNRIRLILESPGDQHAESLQLLLSLTMKYVRRNQKPRKEQKAFSADLKTINGLSLAKLYKIARGPTLVAQLSSIGNSNSSKHPKISYSLLEEVARSDREDGKMVREAAVAAHSRVHGAVRADESTQMSHAKAQTGRRLNRVIEICLDKLTDEQKLRFWNHLPEVEIPRQASLSDAHLKLRSSGKDVYWVSRRNERRRIQFIPHGLRVDLSGTATAELSPLVNAHDLTYLALDLSDSTPTLGDVENQTLNGLRNLRVALRRSSNLEPLMAWIARQHGLESLELDLSYSQDLSADSINQIARVAPNRLSINLDGAEPIDDNWMKSFQQAFDEGNVAAFELSLIGTNVREVVPLPTATDDLRSLTLILPDDFILPRVAEALDGRGLEQLVLHIGRGSDLNQLANVLAAPIYIKHASIIISEGVDVSSNSTVRFTSKVSSIRILTKRPWSVALQEQCSNHSNCVLEDFVIQ